MSGIEIEYADVEFNLIFGVNKSKVVNKKLQNLRKTLNESKSIKLSNTIIFD